MCVRHPAVPTDALKQQTRRTDSLRSRLLLMPTESAPPLNAGYSVARAWLLALLAEGAGLADVHRACQHDPQLLRLGRHAWVSAQLDAGVPIPALAVKTGLSRETLRTWRLPVEPCGCGRLKRATSRTCGACTPQRARWTEQALLAARDRFRAEMGRDPQGLDWRSGRASTTEGVWPSHATVLRRFVTWDNFLRS